MSCGCGNGTRIEGGPAASREARSVLAAELDERIEPARMADLHLLVSEIVNNSVIHGQVDEDGWIELEWDVSPERLRVEIRDSGVQGLPERREPDFVSGGGFGLFIVDALCSRWGVDHNPVLRVWFELALDGDS
jgi:anti-sigma regulatory factor (Ser/Thr protein kinase)